MTNRPVIVVENDPFPRLLQAFLDTDDIPERTAAIADFVAYDIPDYGAWLARARERARGLYPAEVRVASTQDDLRAKLPGATVVVTESLAIGREELARADRLRVVHKFGTVMRNVDVAACTERGIRILKVRRRANIAVAEHAFGLMLSLAKTLRGTATLQRFRRSGADMTQLAEALA
jgi:phosphoglycerate dehydrogenase-like enzyme